MLKSGYLDRIYRSISMLDYIKILCILPLSTLETDIYIFYLKMYTFHFFRIKEFEHQGKIVKYICTTLFLLWLWHIWLEMIWNRYLGNVPVLVRPVKLIWLKIFRKVFNISLCKSPLSAHLHTAMYLSTVTARVM